MEILFSVARRSFFWLLVGWFVKGKCFVQRDVHCKIRSWIAKACSDHVPSATSQVALVALPHAPTARESLLPVFHLAPVSTLQRSKPNVVWPWNLPRALHTQPVAASSAAPLLMGHCARHWYCPYLLSHSSMSLLPVAGWGQSLPGLSMYIPSPS